MDELPRQLQDALDRGRRANAAWRRSMEVTKNHRAAVFAAAREIRAAGGSLEMIAAVFEVSTKMAWKLAK